MREKVRRHYTLDIAGVFLLGSPRVVVLLGGPLVNEDSRVRRAGVQYDPVLLGDGGRKYISAENIF